MHRRIWFKLLSTALGLLSAATVVIPGLGYIAEIIRRRPAGQAAAQRVIRLRDLTPRRPQAVPIVGSRQDAWTLYPAEMIGRVFLVRETDDSVEDAQARVVAFSSICPHLGCQIQLDTKGERFTCPCHQAAFKKDGAIVPEKELGHRNQAPRGLDKLAVQLVKDEGSGEWWVAVAYQRFEQGLTRQVAKS